ncbi:putative DNA repair protein [Acanthamoeba polyphaga moumouvirus]|uniref:Putative DNA repair protein n=1 Tax=Acanthamoeba polyphaga moumouvirus TaxID=1269028 RepID=L7RD01_9VIRU|nr:putative DNA repair protein [Acanthamoeba polyphaga moumouvirus]AGC02121.1 putative DNA repair protein [Acanthamoeba polyphaga moumouvirus]
MATKKSVIDIIKSDNSETASDKSNSSELSESSDKSITYIKLEDDGKKEIEYVYHISDIHIRNTQRHQEYRDVFERTYCKLKSSIGNNESRSLIVLTGDIMHTKTELSPEAVSIAYHFFKSLNEIAPVILIPGNHDCNLSNKNRLDALSPIVEDVGKLQNLYYLKKSGIYQYQNIVFGVTSVFDDILVSAKKINTEMWKKIKQKKKYKIALYHGPVHNAKTDVGFRMNNEQLLAEDFDGYDYVMLGDIHKFQFMNESKTIAYSGSLIQQSYGETLNKHGILKWNLSEQKTEFLEIKNDFGFCTVKIVDGQMIETEIPKKPRIRFILENTNQLQYQEVVNNLEKKYLIQEIVKESSFKTKMHNDSPSQKTIKKETGAYTTQEVIIKKYLEKKELDQVSVNNIIELHKKIYQKILSQKKDQVADVMHNAIKNQKWRLLELKFSNTLSYGKDNVIDFRKYDTNKIIGIVAPNHYGKSAILDIILFCLFDKCSRGERRDILNKNENSMYCSLLFSVGSQEYLIERLGCRNKNGLTVKIDVNFYLLEKDKNGKIIKKNLNGLDKNDTNKKISEIIGDYNDYLTTCFCLQQGKSLNFTDMTQLQKKEYLNDILKLNVFEDCYNYARDKLKELTGKLKILEQKVGQKSLEEIKSCVKDLNEEIKKLESNKNHVENNLISLIQLSIDKHKKHSLTTYNELSHYNFKTIEEIVEKQKDIQKIINKELDIDINQINNTRNETIEKLKKIEEEINILELQEKIKILISKKEELLRKIIKLPENFDNKLDENLIKQKEQSLEKISTINTVLENHKNKDLSDKMCRIDELKIIISNLRKSLKIVTENPLEQIQEVNQKMISCALSLNENIYKIFNSKHTKYNPEKLKIILLSKNKYIKQIKNIKNILDKYEIGTNDKNDQVIKELNNELGTIYDKYLEWIQQTNIYLDTTKNILPDIDKIKNEYNNTRQEIYIKSGNLFNHYDNQNILKNIDIAQKELDALSEFSGTKKEVENLKNERNIHEEKIKMIDNQLELYNQYINNNESNKNIQNEIDIISNEITSLQEICDNHQKMIIELKKIISKCDLTLKENEKQIKEKNKAILEYKLLEIYYLEYFNWDLKNKILDKLLLEKEEQQKIVDEIIHDINKKEAEINVYKKEIEQYLLHRKEYDEVSNQSNLYQLYVQIMNYNGLPYEMLKTYLPMIESDVNQILHSMVNFNIEFMYYDEEKIKEQKSKQLKSNMGSIDINICYNDLKPYNVQLASGFERFIIGLAIRMTLCQISLTAKPNFLIIDEGWSCLDTENLNNVGTIMNYIKTQYEYVIIISHLEELKNQADYVINIDKHDNYSYIKDNVKIIKNKKK